MAREVIVASQPSEVSLDAMKNDQRPASATFEVAYFRAANADRVFLVFSRRH
jgi:hypothetical protein